MLQKEVENRKAEENRYKELWQKADLKNDEFKIPDNPSRFIYSAFAAVVKASSFFDVKYTFFF